jgi:hypothetical protein
MKVFLSHTSVDKPIVEKIGRVIEAAGHEVWIDKWCMTAGDSLIEKIGEAIDSSERLIVFLSPESVESNWVKQEISTGKIIEIATKRGIGEKFVIPVILKTCKIPWYLRDKLYANFTDKAFDTACKELISGIENIPQKHNTPDIKNEYILLYKSKLLSTGNFSTVIEFGVHITPVNGFTASIKHHEEILNWFYWVGTSNNPSPISLGVDTFTDYRELIKEDLIAIFFSDPQISSIRSLYIEITTKREIKDGMLKFGFCLKS